MLRPYNNHLHSGKAYTRDYTPYVCTQERHVRVHVCGCGGALVAAWLAAPLLCTVELPVMMRQSMLPVCQGLQYCGRNVQRELFVGPRTRSGSACGVAKNSSMTLRAQPWQHLVRLGCSDSCTTANACSHEIRSLAE